MSLHPAVPAAKAFTQHTHTHYERCLDAHSRQPYVAACLLCLMNELPKRTLTMGGCAASRPRTACHDAPRLLFHIQIGSAWSALPRFLL